MRTAFIVVLLSLIPFGSIAQDTPLKPDGRMWEMFGNSDDSRNLLIKGAYVQGVIEGLRVGATVGYLSGRLDESNDALNYLQPCLKGPCAGIPLQSLIRTGSDIADGWLAGADKVRDKYVLSNTSVLDIVRQTDKFYSDYRNTPVCMIVAVQESISSLSGKAMSEQELEMTRTGCNP